MSRTYKRINKNFSIHLIDNKKCGVPSPKCYERLFKSWDIITILDETIMSYIETGETLDENAQLIRSNNDDGVFLTSHGNKRLITSAPKFDYYGFSWDKVVNV